MSELEEIAEHIREAENQLMNETKLMLVQTTSPPQDALQHEQHRFLQGVVDELIQGNGSSPRLVIQKGLEAFSKVEAKAFVIWNILESIKGGKSLSQTLKDYYDLGLTEVNPEQTPLGLHRPEPKDSVFLVGLLKTFKTVGEIILNLVVSAFRCSAEMVGVKPSVGVAGWFPTISFTFESESVTGKEVWEHIRTAFK
jgi:hypothetical protein